MCNHDEQSPSASESKISPAIELLYVWISSDETRFIKNQGFNLSPNYNFEITQGENGKYILSCNENPAYYNVWNITKSTNQIPNLTAVVGENGSGKSTLLKYLSNTSIAGTPDANLDDDSDEISDDTRMVKIYRHIDTDAIQIFHNFEENEFQIPIKYEKKIVRLSDDDQKNAEIFSNLQTPIYMTNAIPTAESVSEYKQNQNTLFFSPTKNEERARTFYRKICGIDWMDQTSGLESSNHSFYRERVEQAEDGLHPFFYLQLLIHNRRIKDFDKLITVFYYHRLFLEKIKESTDTSINTFNNEITIGVENLYRFSRPLHHGEKKWRFCSDNWTFSQLLSKYGQERSTRATFMLNGNTYRSRVFDKITNALTNYLNLEKTLIYEFLLPGLLNGANEEHNEKNKFHYSGLSDSAKGKLEEYFAEAATEIEELGDILDKYIPIGTEIPLTRIDGAPRIQLTPTNPVYDEFCKYIEGLIKKGMSFVLKYLIIEIPPMSSGELALQNIFSWLTLIPHFKCICGEEAIPIQDNILLLLDEVDLYMHPEWQRKFLYSLSKRLEAEYSNKHVQIIISTHSPLVLSDIPLRNTIYLDKAGTSCILADRTDAQESFGANLFSLLKDSFFLKKTIGEFSYAKMSEVFENLTLLKKLINLDKKHRQNLITKAEETERTALLEKKGIKSTDDFKKICQEYDSVIQIIGEPVVRRKLQMLYDEVFPNDEKNQYKQNLEKLNHLLEYGDEKTKAQYRELLAKIVSDSSSH